MPTGASYGRVLAKCDWAEKHIDDFNVAVDRLRNANRDIVQPDVDPQTGDVSYRLALVPEVPVEVALTLGHALHNLRSALDYLAWGMVELSASGRLSTRRSQFLMLPMDTQVASLERYRALGSHADRCSTVSSHIKREGRPTGYGNFTSWTFVTSTVFF